MNIRFFMTPMLLLACTSSRAPSFADAGTDARAFAPDAGAPDAAEDAVVAADANSVDAEADAALDASEDTGDAELSEAGADAGQSEGAFFLQESSALCLGCDDFDVCEATWTAFLASHTSVPAARARACEDADAFDCMTAEVADNALTCTPSLAMNTYPPCARCNLGTSE